MHLADSKQKAVAYLEAHFAGDAERATSLCAADYETIVHAPIDIFPHLGQKKGLSWVEESIRTQIARYSERRLDVIKAVGGETDAGVLGKVRLTKRSDERVIEFMSMHFFGFKDGLIARHHEMFDSFSLVEQLVGQDLTQEFAGRLAAAMDSAQPR